MQEEGKCANTSAVSTPGNKPCCEEGDVIRACTLAVCLLYKHVRIKCSSLVRSFDHLVFRVFGCCSKKFTPAVQKNNEGNSSIAGGQTNCSWNLWCELVTLLTFIIRLRKSKKSNSYIIDL